MTAVAPDAPRSRARHDARVARPGRGRRAQWRRRRRRRPARCCAHARAAPGGTCSPSSASRCSSRASTSTCVHRAAAPRGGRPRSPTCRCRIPSGLAVDRDARHRARREHAQPEPGLRPARRRGGRRRGRRRARRAPPERPLVPVRSRFYPGCLYLHDLALVGGELHGNAVGQNAVVRLDDDGGYERVWWPRVRSRRAAGPDFGRNYLQLNSIAAGADLASSFFSASADAHRRAAPGPSQLPGRPPRRRLLRRDARARRARADAAALGAAARRRAVGGQQRLRRGRRLSTDGRFEAVARLPGWTRGLVLPRRRRVRRHVARDPALPQYAPGLDLDAQRLRRPRGRHAHRARSSAASSGRTATRSSPIEPRARRASAPGCPFAAGAPAPRDARARAVLLLSRRDRGGPTDSMSDDFRLLMLGAMYENGGNTTHRFLDGHPQLFVYPFESQLGTRLVNDAADVDVPGEVPLAGRSRSTPRRRRTTARSSTRRARSARARPHVSKFRARAVRPRRRRARGDATSSIVERDAAARAANNMAAFFRATFDAWKDYKRQRPRERSTSATARSSSSTPRRSSSDLPGRARPARRAQPVVGLRRHEEAAGAAVARRTTCSAGR